MDQMPSTAWNAKAMPLLESVGLSSSDLAMAMLHQSKDCIKLLSVDGHLEFMNCNGLAAMEIDEPDAVIGRLWWELWPIASRELVKRKFRDAVQGHESRFEASCPTAKGSYRRWIVNLKPLCTAEGHVVSVLSSSWDVTVDRQD